MNVAEGRKLLGLPYQVVWGGMSKTLAHVLFLRADGVCWILCDVFRVLLVGLIKRQKKRKLQNRLFLRCLASQFGAVRTIHAVVVEGEGDAHNLGG